MHSYGVSTGGQRVPWGSFLRASTFVSAGILYFFSQGTRNLLKGKKNVNSNSDCANDWYGKPPDPHGSLTGLIGHGMVYIARLVV